MNASTSISKQKKQSLKQQSHHLEPVVLLGTKGLTDSVHREIEVALEAHELIKIKLSGKDKAEKQQLTETICNKHNATLIMQIGHVITVYRKKLD